MELATCVEELPSGGIVEVGPMVVSPDTLYEWLGLYKDGLPKTLHQTGYSDRVEVALTAYIKAASILTDKAKFIPVPIEKIAVVTANWVRRRETLGDIDDIFCAMCRCGLFEVFLCQEECYVMPTDLALMLVSKAVKCL